MWKRLCTQFVTIDREAFTATDGSGWQERLTEVFCLCSGTSLKGEKELRDDVGFGFVMLTWAGTISTDASWKLWSLWLSRGVMLCACCLGIVVRWVVCGAAGAA